MNPLSIKRRMQVMIELGRAAAGFVAFPTIIAQDSIVGIVLEMTTFTANITELVTTLGMTFIAEYQLVKAGQGKR